MIIIISALIQVSFFLFRLSEYVDWSLTEFPISTLVDGKAFPSFTALQLDLVDANGENIVDDSNNKFTYLPFIDPQCILNVDSSIQVANTTIRPGSSEV